MKIHLKKVNFIKILILLKRNQIKRKIINLIIIKIKIKL
jgi:hypothetical protein